MNPLEIFISLARCGRHRGCSSGEEAAHKLALAILEHAPALDGMAIEGAVEFLERAPLAPILARQLVAADRKAS